MFNNLSTTSTAVLIIAALVPAILLLTYVYRHDTVEKEPARLLWSLVFGGVLAALLSIVLELWSQTAVTVHFDGSVLSYVVATTIMIGLIEEGTKLHFLKKKTWNDPSFNYSFDGIVYAVTVSLGFAAFENILYVLEYGLVTAAARAVLAVPAHASFAVLMGVYYAQAKGHDLRNETGKCRLDLALSLVGPMMMHMIYDCTAMLAEDFMLFVFLGFTAVMFLVVYRRLKKSSRMDRSL